MTMIATHLRQQLLASSFARHALTIGGGVAVGQGIAVALSPVLSRLYTPAEMGLLAIYTATAGMLAIFATSGYEQAILLPRAHRQAAALLAFLLLLAATVALGLGVPLLVLRGPIAGFLGAPGLAPWLGLLPLSVALSAWYQALRFWAMRRAAFGDVARNTVLRLGLGTLLACLLGLRPPLADFPESGLILSAILAEAAGNLFLLRGIWQRERQLFNGLSRRQLLMAARRWRRFALGFAVAQCVATVYQRLPILAIAWLFGPGVAGLYAWAERFAALPQQLVANAIGDVYRQYATAEYHRSGRFDALMLRTVKTTALLAVAPYALGIWLAPWLFERLFGPVWAEAGTFAAIFMVGDFFCFVFTPVDKAAVIRQRTGFILAWNTTRVAGKTLIVAYILISGSGVRAFIWLLVALRIILYITSFAYAMHLARGDASDRLSAISPARHPPGSGT